MFRNSARLLWFAALLGLLASVGCKRKKEKPAPQLEITAEKTEEEERNLKALCKAAIDVMKVPGVQDRLGRMAEIAAPISASTYLLDGLAAMEGPKRMGFVRQLIDKYKLHKDCRGALPAFDRGPPQPGQAAIPGQPALPPGQPGVGQPPGGLPPGGQPGQPGMAPGQPGMPPGQPGVAPGQPGMPAGQPGTQAPGAQPPVGQPGGQPPGTVPGAAPAPGAGEQPAGQPGSWRRRAK